jgi:MerR family transcriptional regulator, copper efflux regulator
MAALKIGSLAGRTGTNVPTIRYYEAIGLLPRAGRQSGGQRIYGEDDVWRLTFIRRCRDLGLSIARVKSLVALAQDRERPCMEARDLAQEHLTVVRSRMKELKTLKRSIAGFVASCDRAPVQGGPVPNALFSTIWAGRQLSSQSIVCPNIPRQPPVSWK